MTESPRGRFYLRPHKYIPKESLIKNYKEPEYKGIDKIDFFDNLKPNKYDDTHNKHYPAPSLSSSINMNKPDDVDRFFHYKDGSLDNDTKKIGDHTQPIEFLYLGKADQLMLHTAEKGYKEVGQVGGLWTNGIKDADGETALPPEFKHKNIDLYSEARDAKLLGEVQSKNVIDQASQAVKEKATLDAWEAKKKADDLAKSIKPVKPTDEELKKQLLEQYRNKEGFRALRANAKIRKYDDENELKKREYDIYLKNLEQEKDDEEMKTNPERAHAKKKIIEKNKEAEILERKRTHKLMQEWRAKAELEEAKDRTKEEKKATKEYTKNIIEKLKGEMPKTGAHTLNNLNRLRAEAKVEAAKALLAKEKAEKAKAEADAAKKALGGSSSKK